MYEMCLANEDRYLGEENIKFSQYSGPEVCTFEPVIGANRTFELVTYKVLEVQI